MHTVIPLVIKTALFLGAVLLFRESRRRFASGKCGQGYVSAFAGVATLFLFVLLLLPAPPRARALAPRTACQSNLHQLDLALQANCNPPVDIYPTNLADINPEFVSPKLFVCAASGNLPGDLTNVMEWTDYVYVSGLSPAAPADVPVLICPPMFHPKGHAVGGNALMGDHSCSWYTNVAYLNALIRNPLAFYKDAPASLRSNIYVHVSKRIEEQSKGKYRSHGLK